MEISGKQIEVRKSDIVKKSTVQSIMITTPKNFANSEGKKSNGLLMEGMDYDDVKEHVEKNRKKYFGTDNTIQINVLTAQGWRAGDYFNSNAPIKWFSSSDEYSEKYDVKTIYGFQITIYPKP